MYNERKDSIAKNIVLKDISDISDIDKNSIKVTDENGKEIPKDKYTIEEKTDEKNNKIFEMKFKDIYLIDRETNKEEITKKQNISPSTTFKKINVKYNIGITNERENSIAKKVTLLEKTTNGRLDKDSIKVKDGNGIDIPKENYDIVEENGKITLKFKDDIYILGKNSDKEKVLNKNNIGLNSKKVYDKINITYDVIKDKGKDSIDTTIINSNDNIIDENRK